MLILHIVCIRNSCRNDFDVINYKIMIKRYYCGNGEGMFEDKKGHWIEYKEYLKLKRLYNKLVDETFQTVDCYVNEYVDSTYHQMMGDLKELKQNFNKKI